jgi:hypothetical protein
VAQSGDLSPRLMMLAVTRPLEEAAREVLGVRACAPGRSAARRSFPSSSIRTPTCRTPAVDAGQGRRSPRGHARSDEVRVERMTPAFFPMMEFNVTGDCLRPTSATSRCSSCGRCSAGFDGISRVDVIATDEREVSVIVDPTS